MLELIKKLEKYSKSSDWYGLFRCSCGKEFKALNNNVKRGNTTSCGCYQKKRQVDSNTRHGKTNTVTYVRWCSMKCRCTNPNYIQYQDYGGRGIKYDPRWEVFENFLEDLGECPYPDWSLERIDVDGNYCKENCKWIPKREQMKNTRRSKALNLTKESRTSR